MKFKKQTKDKITAADLLISLVSCVDEDKAVEKSLMLLMSLIGMSFNWLISTSLNSAFLFSCDMVSLSVAFMTLGDPFMFISAVRVVTKLATVFRLPVFKLTTAGFLGSLVNAVSNRV